MRVQPLAGKVSRCLCPSESLSYWRGWEASECNPAQLLSSEPVESGLQVYLQAFLSVCVNVCMCVHEGTEEVLGIHVRHGWTVSQKSL